MRYSTLSGAHRTHTLSVSLTAVGVAFAARGDEPTSSSPPTSWPSPAPVLVSTVTPEELVPSRGLLVRVTRRTVKRVQEVHSSWTLPIYSMPARGPGVPSLMRLHAAVLTI